MKLLQKWCRACVAAILAAALLAGCTPSAKKLDWPTAGLATVLPQPENAKGEIQSNSAGDFDVEIRQATETDYQAYAARCADAGFTVDAKQLYAGYEAYNADGYHLRLSFSGSSKSYTIYLDAPRKMEPVSWPTMGLALLLPVPQSAQGKITVDSADHFATYFGDMPMDAYNEYVNLCIAAGFDQDHSKGDTSYKAQNANGDKLNVSYEGFNTVSVSLYAAEKPAVSEAPAASEPAAQSSAAPEPAPESVSAADGIRPEFKAAMDSYEAFFDEYIAFIEKYQKSNNTAVMLGDYAKYMARYADTMKKLSDLEDDDLTDAEALYYAEVMLRISQKLAKIQ